MPNGGVYLGVASKEHAIGTTLSQAELAELRELLGRLIRASAKSEKQARDANPAAAADG